jgi:hypothetical protein
MSGIALILIFSVLQLNNETLGFYGKNYNFIFFIIYISFILV